MVVIIPVVAGKGEAFLHSESISNSHIFKGYCGSGGCFGNKSRGVQR